jgi:hypothetical protein
MSDVETFLGARLDDLERNSEWHVFDCAGMPWHDGDACCPVERDRRRFVAFCRDLLAEYTESRGSGGISPDYYGGLWYSLWRLASMWADHPDFDPDWEVDGVTLHKQPYAEKSEA